MPENAVLAGRYQLGSELGRGGMGVVWEAFDELLHRDVAVKEVNLPSGMSSGDRARLVDRTMREARAVAALDTRAAVRVFDVVEEQGKPWLVMELVRGRTLTDRLRDDGPVPSQEVARIGLDLLTALEATHAAGVLHRDVKPSNVLLGDDGRVALSDFGIAAVDSDPSDTTTNVLVGSPSYVAPERARGEKPSPASDLWSLAATLWTAAEGRPPYQADNPLLVLNAVATQDPPPCELCDEPLRQLLLEMMSPAPESRPSTLALRDRLLRIAEMPEAQDAPEESAALPPSFDRTGVLEPPPVRRHRTGWGWFAAAAVILLAGAVAVALTGFGRSAPSTSGRTAAGRHSSPTSAGAGSGSAGGSRGSAVPAGFTRYTDPSLGWSVDVPAGWQSEATADGTKFVDPTGGRYLLVATRYPAGPSALGAWQTQEQAFRADHTAYRRVRLQQITVPGAADAADWEFLYTQDGARLHALDRGMVFGDRGYAVYVQSHSDQWQGSQSLWRVTLHSFRPATG